MSSYHEALEAQPGRNSGQGRRRNAFACEACRSRRTKCDGRRPQCTACSRLGFNCIYHEPIQPAPTRLELEVTTIRERLSRIELLLQNRQAIDEPASLGSLQIYASTSPVLEFPFMIIKTPATLNAFGLSPGLATHLLAVERNEATHSVASDTSRLFVLEQHRAMSALAAFAEKCHIWYPLLHPNFTDQFATTMNGDFSPSSDTCLALVVTAIGVLVDKPSTVLAVDERPDAVFIEAALTMLPIVITESSIRSLQCLVLLSIYYNCRIRPCQAHDYALIASMKVQSILKGHIYANDTDSMELLRRAYWTILLVESELNIQLDLAESGIWRLDDDMSLPSGHETWNFTRDSTSSADASTSPDSISSTGSTSDEMLTYFLAEIAMRRMLQRCTTSVSNTTHGGLVFAPIIAAELEHQLEEWYDYLPGLLRFDKDPSRMPMSNHHPLSQFLCIQYMAYKASIYWPAAYQAQISVDSVAELTLYCSKFFESYVAFVASAELVIHQCPPNVWTICASVFIITMSAHHVANSSTLPSLLSSQIKECFERAASILDGVKVASPSILHMYDILREIL